MSYLQPQRVKGCVSVANSRNSTADKGKNTRQARKSAAKIEKEQPSEFSIVYRAHDIYVGRSSDGLQAGQSTWMDAPAITHSNMEDINPADGKPFLPVQTRKFQSTEIPEASRCSHLQTGMKCDSGTCYVQQVTPKNADSILSGPIPWEGAALCYAPRYWKGDIKGERISMPGELYIVCVEGCSDVVKT